MEYMRSAVFLDQPKNSNHRHIQVQTFQKPVCEDDKILVRIKASGICTFEQRVFTGVHQVAFPYIGGHEIAGEIVEIGRDVQKYTNQWKIGDQVVVGATQSCGFCKYCQSGHSEACIYFTSEKRLPGQPWKGSGGFSEYMMQRPNCIFKYYNVSPMEACMTEPLSCVIHSVEMADPQFGDTCVIVGCGIMGLLHVELCVRKGTQVIVVEPDEKRRRLAEEIGAHYAIDPKKENVLELIKKITHGEMVNCVFNTIPVASSVDKSLEFVTNRGCLVIYSGIYPNMPISVNAHRIHRNSIRILGTANSNEQDFIRATSLISNRIIDMKKYISGIYKVEEIEKALISSCTGPTFRNIVVFDEK